MDTMSYFNTHLEKARRNQEKATNERDRAFWARSEEHYKSEILRLFREMRHYQTLCARSCANRSKLKRKYGQRGLEVARQDNLTLWRTRFAEVMEKINS